MTQNLGTEAAGLAEDALDHAVSSAEGSAEGFSPFAMVLQQDGARELTRFIAAPDLTMARSSAADTNPTAVCVTLAWDGYLTIDDERAEAAFVEAYELGRPAGVLIAQRYERQGDALTRVGAPIVCAEPEPLVPLTLELARRHTKEFGDGGHQALRELVEQAGGDVDAFDVQPMTCQPIMDAVTDELRSDDLDDDDRIYLHSLLSAYLAEVLIRANGGHWDVAFENGGIKHMVVVGDRQVDPFSLVNEEAKEGRSASQMLDRARETVGL
ncbi:hypothetical protein ABGB18_00270 [Nonomuraea sp. B12E4]|uniref:hypothetical protein n=1 Tax=Nonomuraea sp. B12E4 TaxID=3153564 RepID=UPI00325EB63A